MKFSKLIVSLAIAAASVPALADTATQTVNRLEAVDNASSYGFRVALTGVSAICGGGPDWAYINDTDTNYKAIVALLMMARGLGSQITVYSSLSGSGCKIYNVTLRNY